MYGNSDYDWHENKNDEIRASAAAHQELEHEKEAARLKAAVHAVERLSRKPMPDAVEHLRELVTALDNAFISTWQSTAAWQKQLDAAREYLAAHNIKERP